MRKNFYKLLATIILMVNVSFKEKSTNDLAVLPDGLHTFIRSLQKIKPFFPLPIQKSEKHSMDGSLEKKKGIGELLNKDGTLNLQTGYSGMINLDNYKISIDPAKGPVAALAPPDDCNATVDLILSNNMRAINNYVYAIAVDGNSVYIGGDFTNAGGVLQADYIARWDGTNWHALGSNIDGNNGALRRSVDVIKISGNNIYIGGNFQDVAEIPQADRIARWDGTNWHALGSNGAGDGAIDSSVEAIDISGNNIYVGGWFTNAGGIAQADRIARWDGANWHALGSNAAGTNGAFDGYAGVDAIAISGNNVYVGGNFDNVAGISQADNIARWDGNSWNAVGGGLSSNVQVLAIAGNNLYVGGDFINAGGIATADHIVKWDGANWSALGSNGAGDGAIPSYSSVLDIAINGNDVYVGGSFTNAAGIPQADRLAKWNGTSWSALGSNSTNTDGALNHFVRTIAVSGSDVYIGGWFTDVSGISQISWITKWNDNRWNALGTTGVPLNNYVETIAIKGNDVYIGGEFRDVANIPQADYIVKWDGTNWSALGSNAAGTNGALNLKVNTIVVGGNDIYVGGRFDNVAGIPQADKIARWDGANWHALGSNAAGTDGVINNHVHTIDISGNNVYVGGEFENVAGIPQADKIARWDGSNWYALGSNTAGNNGALNEIVNVIKINGDNIYVGGRFENVSGIPQADKIARWDGVNWHALGSDASGTNGPITGINSIIDIGIRGNDVYVVGAFLNLAGIPQADRIARWDGANWHALGSNASGTNGAEIRILNTIAISGNNIYVAGDTDYILKWHIEDAQGNGKWSKITCSPLAISLLAASDAINCIVVAKSLPTTTHDTLYVGGGIESHFIQINNAGALYSVNFLSFTGQWSSDVQITLDWTTKEEEGIEEYIVERSSVGGNFTAIGQVTAHNTSGTHQYQYIDNNPPYETNLYRLKMVYENGTTSYSEVIQIDYEENSDITIYPNPVSNGRDITINTGRLRVNNLRLINSGGMVVKQNNLAGISPIINLQTLGLAAGVYILQLRTTEGIISRKILVQ